MPVTKRVRIVLWVAGIVAALATVVMISTAFIILRTLNSTPAEAATAAEAFESTRRRFPAREPLVVVGNFMRGEFRINRVPNAPRKSVDTLHFMYWDPEDKKLVRGEAPTWALYLRVSVLGIGNLKFSDLHLTVEDIERYAPGIILDFKTPDAEQVIVWAE